MNQTISMLPEEIRKYFKKVTPIEVLKLRLSGKPHIIIKSDNEFFAYSEKSTRDSADELKHFFEEHKCPSCGNFFRNGKLCPKVSDCSVTTCRRFVNSDLEAIKDSKRIEKYSFVIEGIEYFNVDREYLIVSKCMNYVKGQKNDGKRDENASFTISKLFRQNEVGKNSSFKKYERIGRYPRK